MANFVYIWSHLQAKDKAPVTNTRIPEQEVQRVIRWFEKDGDNLVGEKPIGDVTLSTLQKLFGISRENPMYDCYPVEFPEQTEYLQKVLNVEIDTQSYDYFLECDAM